MTNDSIRAPRGARSLVIAVGMALIAASPAPAQVPYNSNGFENPPFVPGPLARNPSSPIPQTGQDGWLTTDLAQIGGAAGGAGQVQQAIVSQGTQAVQVIGSRLVNDTTFAGATTWYRNFPSFAGSFNPVANGTPFVIISMSQRVSGTPPITTSDMPFAGIHMEAFTAGGANTQQTNLVMRNANGGVTVVGPGGGGFATPDNIWPPNVFRTLQATYDFANQRVGVTLDGVPLAFTPAGGGAPVTTVPFRNTFGTSVTVSEYGFNAFFNSVSGVTTNDAFFDNFTVTASPVPEPASILALCAGAAAVGWRIRRRKLV